MQLDRTFRRDAAMVPPAAGSLMLAHRWALGILTMNLCRVFFFILTLPNPEAFGALHGV